MRASAAMGGDVLGKAGIASTLPSGSALPSGSPANSRLFSIVNTFSVFLVVSVQFSLTICKG